MIILNYDGKEIDGAQLANELKIANEQMRIEGNQIIILADIDKKNSEEILKNHVPIPPNPKTIQEKLIDAGIDLQELREALGL